MVGSLTLATLCALLPGSGQNIALEFFTPALWRRLAVSSDLAIIHDPAWCCPGDLGHSPASEFRNVRFPNPCAGWSHHWWTASAARGS
jgi:hypothetical protein